MKRRAEKNNNRQNRNQKKNIIDSSSFLFLSQDNYNIIFQQTGDYRILFPLLFVSKTFNEFTKQFLNNNYKNKIKCFYYVNLFCDYLGETNQISLLKWLYSINCLFNPNIFYIGSSNNNDNNLDLLKWLLEIFEPKDSILKKVFIKKYHKEERFLEKIVCGAAEKNNQNILFFIKETYPCITNDDGNDPLYFFKSAVKGAIRGNQLNLLKLTLNPTDEKGNWYYYKHFYPGTIYYKDALLQASKYGSHEVLEFLFKIFERCCLWGEVCRSFIEIFTTAFEYGHIKIMEWIIFEKRYIDKNNLFMQIIWYENLVSDENYRGIFQKTILRGSICSLEWAFSKDIMGNKICGDYGSKLFQYAAEQGRIDLLDFFKSHDLEYNDSTCAGAALSDSFECLQWAIKNGHPTSFWVSACAAAKGNIKMLEWLYGNFHPINSISTAFSILNGYKRTTRWLMDHGFSLTSDNLSFLFSEKNLNKKLKTMCDISNRKTFYSYWIETKKKDLETSKDSWVSLDHGKAMTWSLYDHHPDFARMTSEQSSDHGKAMTCSQSDHHQKN
jgi:hypothetical protein